MTKRQDALDYHANGRPGKIAVVPTKPLTNQRDLSLAYSPGVAEPCLEVESETPDDVIKFCQLLEPTVGGINLEDIRAPDCFYIEETLRKTLKIPVFHDDQHGTAIISGAALLNALEIVQKNIGEIRVVFSGAGAAAISTAEHYVRLGVARKNIILCDRA